MEPFSWHTQNLRDFPFAFLSFSPIRLFLHPKADSKSENRNSIVATRSSCFVLRISVSSHSGMEKSSLLAGHVTLFPNATHHRTNFIVFLFFLLFHLKFVLICPQLFSWGQLFFFIDVTCNPVSMIYSIMILNERHVTSLELSIFSIFHFIYKFLLTSFTSSSFHYALHWS